MALERKRSSRRSNYRYQPKKKTASLRCKNCCRKFTAFMFSHIGLCGLVVGYSIMGGFAFKALEASHDERTTGEVEEFRNETVNNLWDITLKFNILYRQNWTEDVQKEVLKFQEKIIKAVKDGYDGNRKSTQWSFPRAFLYSLTVITTIGYGDVAPRTDLGKGITVIYAIIGIPLMLLYLTNIGDILAKSFKYLYSRAYRCGGSGSGGGSSGSGVGGGGGGGSQDSYKRRRGNENYRAHHMVAQNSPNKHNAVTEAPLKDKVGVGMVTEDEVRIETIPDAVMEEDEYEKPVVTVPITLCLLILTGYIILGASIFMVWEGWSFLDSSYFCFVTLSTIGFGDLVPGDNVISNDNSQEKLVLCSLYLLVGMAVIAMCFNLMQEEVIHKVRNFGMKIGIIKAQEDEVD